jgi:hypothetical protein
VDDFPRRLSATLPSGRAEPLYVGLLGAAASHERLRSSAWAGGGPAGRARGAGTAGLPRARDARRPRLSGAAPARLERLGRRW